jgi:hypothetical protein
MREIIQSVTRHWSLIGASSGRARLRWWAPLHGRLLGGQDGKTQFVQNIIGMFRHLSAANLVLQATHLGTRACTQEQLVDTQRLVADEFQEHLADHSQFGDIDLLVFTGCLIDPIQVSVFDERKITQRYAYNARQSERATERERERERESVMYGEC